MSKRKELQKSFLENTKTSRAEFNIFLLCNVLIAVIEIQQFCCILKCKLWILVSLIVVPLCNYCSKDEIEWRTCGKEVQISSFLNILVERNRRSD